MSLTLVSLKLVALSVANVNLFAISITATLPSTIKLDPNLKLFGPNWISGVNHLEAARHLRETFAKDRMQDDANKAYYDVPDSVPETVVGNCNGFGNPIPHFRRSVAADPYIYTYHDFITKHLDESDKESASRTIYVNAASKYHVGGGTETGGRHALEEALCSMSVNLLTSLKKIYAKKINVNNPLEPYFDKNESVFKGEVILSKDILFTRRGTDTGYEPRVVFQLAQAIPELVYTNIISLAMPNYNSGVSDSPNDTFTLQKNSSRYNTAIRSKFIAMLNAADRLKHVTRLVIPDVGCGVFNNDPTVVGNILGDVLKNYTPDHIDEVVISGSEEFKQAVFSHFPNQIIRQTTAFTVPPCPLDLGAFVRRQKSQEDTTMATEESPYGPTTMATVGSPKSESKRRKKDVCPCCFCSSWFSDISWPWYWTSAWWPRSCWGSDYS